MHSILFVLLFVFIYHVKSEAIPKYLRDKLRHASSFLEIAENVEILYHPLYTNKHLQKSYATEGPRQPMRIKAANFIKSSPVQLRNLAVDESMNDRNAMDVDTTEQLSLFGSIKQGSDICQLQSVCVPIPIDNGDPQVVIYPKCYEVMQCVGSCCDAFERCHPHSIRMMERPVIEMIYIGNGRFMLNRTLNISMEEHTSCSCYDCGSNVPECPPGFVVGSDCTCQCANRNDRHNCQGNRQWNPSECKCECESMTCSDDEVFDSDHCDCVYIRRRDKVSALSNNNAFGAVDVSTLPKLHVKRTPTE